MGRDLTKAIELIKAFEGLLDGDPRTVGLDPYLCPAGVWTIGWGHALTDSDGMPLRGLNAQRAAKLKYPSGITKEQASALLKNDIASRAAYLERLYQGVHLTDTQFCALLSWAFNIGVGAAASSTLTLLLKNGRYADVPTQLRRWVKSKGHKLPGLVRRREAEVAVWSGLPWE